MRTIILRGPRGLRLRAAVPDTRRERLQGLLGRMSLEPDEALLLVRTRSVHTFGMRFAIVAALLDRHGLVRAVVRMPPWRVLLPRPRVRHVLELAEGRTCGLGIVLMMVPLRDSDRPGRPGDGPPTRAVAEHQGHQCAQRPPQ